MTLEERLKLLYKQADSCNEEIPAQLSKQIEILCEVLMVIGKLQSEAQNDYGRAYAERKRMFGLTLVNASGTQADKQGQAEVAAYEYRIKEAQAESELVRWKNAFAATTEIINAKKKSLDLLKLEYGMTNGKGSM